MIYSISGVLAKKGGNFAVIETGGIGFHVFMAPNSLAKLPSAGSEVKIFCRLYLRAEENFELYGFLEEKERIFFELLNSVSGVGPKTALSVLSLDKVENLTAAIVENRPDLLTRASGIARKTAERVVLELKNKIKTEITEKAGEITARMGDKVELSEALKSLGYQPKDIERAIEALPSGVDKFEDKLKQCLKQLSRL